MENSLSSQRVLSNCRFYFNAESLLKTREAKGQLNVRLILEALKHFIKKIEALSLENALLKNRLQLPSPTFRRTENINILKANEFRRELAFYRDVDDERIKLKVQMKQLATMIRQFSLRNENSCNDDSMLEVMPSIKFERERFRELLNKMLAIEEKIVKFQKKASAAALLQKQVDKLRDERCKEYKRIRKVTNQYNKQIKSIAYRLKTCKKERNLYVKLTKKLQVEAKEGINKRILYEKKAQELECSNNKLLFELEKAKTHNTELLLQTSVRKDALIRELKLALKVCRNQRDEAVMRNADYQKKLNQVMATINHLKILHWSHSHAPLRKGIKQPIIGEVNCRITANEQFMAIAVDDGVKVDNYETRASSFRYWRKVWRNSNLLLKIHPHIQPPNGLKTEYLITSDEDMASLQYILAPSEDKLNDVVEKKKEQELVLAEHKAEVSNLMSEVRKEF